MGGERQVGGPVKGPSDVCLTRVQVEDTSKGVKAVTKLMEKVGTLGKNYIGGQIRKIEEVAKVTDK